MFQYFSSFAVSSALSGNITYVDNTLGVVNWWGQDYYNDGDLEANGNFIPAVNYFGPLKAAMMNNDA